jgi:hypothetical protein
MKLPLTNVTTNHIRSLGCETREWEAAAFDIEIK